MQKISYEQPRDLSRSELVVKVPKYMQDRLKTTHHVVQKPKISLKSLLASTPKVEINEKQVPKYLGVGIVPTVGEEHPSAPRKRTIRNNDSSSVERDDYPLDLQFTIRPSTYYLPTYSQPIDCRIACPKCKHSFLPAEATNNAMQSGNPKNDRILDAMNEKTLFASPIRTVHFDTVLKRDRITYEHDNDNADELDDFYSGDFCNTSQKLGLYIAIRAENKAPPAIPSEAWLQTLKKKKKNKGEVDRERREKAEGGKKKKKAEEEVEENIHIPVELEELQSGLLKLVQYGDNTIEFETVKNPWEDEMEKKKAAGKSSKKKKSSANKEKTTEENPDDNQEVKVDTKVEIV